MAEGDQPPVNPFDIQQKPHEFTPALSNEKLVALREQIKNIPTEKAAELVGLIEEETKKKKSANEILDVVFGVIGKGVGLFL